MKTELRFVNYRYLKLALNSCISAQTCAMDRALNERSLVTYERSLIARPNSLSWVRALVPHSPSARKSVCKFVHSSTQLRALARIRRALVIHAT